MKKFTNHSSYPVVNAQRNLEGLTHYVDVDTMRFHKARILSAHVLYEGLLFGIIESVSLDWNHTSRGFRGVIFDIFGTIINRVELRDCSGTRKQAEKVFWAEVNSIDAIAHTKQAMRDQAASLKRQAQELIIEARTLGKKS